MKKVLLRIGKLLPKKMLPQFGLFPIDRYYINKFLLELSSSKVIPVIGNSLEFGEIRYTDFFRGDKYIWQYAKTFSIEANTFHGDILRENELKMSFDLIISTQVLPFVPDPHLYIQRVCSLLSNDGVLLLTSPGLGVFPSKYDAERWGDFGRYSMKMIESFVPKGFSIEEKRGYGNFEVLRKLNSNTNAFLVRDIELDNHVENEEVIYGLMLRRSDA